MEIEMGKIYQTRSGRAARIYCVDGGGPHKIHGAIRCDYDHEWYSIKWRKNGMVSHADVLSADDLWKEWREDEYFEASEYLDAQNEAGL